MNTVRAFVRTTAAAAAAALVCAGAATASVAADATVCDRYLISTTIVGDVVVPAGAECHLLYAAVTGDLRAHGNVDVAHSEVQGTVHVEPGGGMSSSDATLNDVRLEDAYAFGSTRASIHGSVRGTVFSAEAYRIRVTGDVSLTGHVPVPGYVPEISLGTLAVEGDVELDGLVTWMANSSVGGAVRIVDAPAPPFGITAVQVCRTEVEGDVRIARSHHIVAIDRHPNGDEYFTCPEYAPQSSTFGSLKLVDNYHSITVGAVTVTGDLRCYNNSGPRGVDTTDATVLGTRYGQCA